ncbi:MAG: alpha/beta hydrolase [Hyphomicrobiales bacterium]|nr:alpha/beta hydrolase [Hyphomicrobiales bacterium]MDE2113444.1 alpha/beta fold hydrolase [Hyphomicrobiales bacterium]
MIWTPGEPIRLVFGNAELEALCLGPPPSEAPTLVLLHEGLGCVALWRDFPQKLQQATGLGVFAYSRSGYGHSTPTPLPRPLDYMTREAVDVLPLVLDAIGFRHGVLLGHSDGASIATLYLGNVQDHRVRGAILMAPHFFTEGMGLAAIAQAKIAYDSGDLRARLARYHQNVDVAFRGWNDAWLDPGFANWNIEDAIDYLRVPVLAIQGREDQYGTLAQLHSLEQHLYSPYDPLVLDHCRHSPFLDQPEACLAAIADFTTRLWRIEQAPGAPPPHHSS